MKDFERFKHIADRVAFGLKSLIRYCPTVIEYEDIKQTAYLELITMLDSPKRQGLNDNQFAAWAQIRIRYAIFQEVRRLSEDNAKFLNEDRKSMEDLEIKNPEIELTEPEAQAVMTRFDEEANTDGATPEKEMMMKECLANLNEREKIIVEMLKNGAKQREIAARFGISQPRVCLMIKKMREKMAKEM